MKIKLILTKTMFKNRRGKINLDLEYFFNLKLIFETADKTLLKR